MTLLACICSADRWSIPTHPYHIDRGTRVLCPGCGRRTAWHPTREADHE